MASIISFAGRKVINPLSKKVGKFLHVTDTVQEKAVQTMTDGGNNLCRILQEVPSEDAEYARKYFERYGFSKGDLKLMDKSMLEKFEILADDKMLQALLSRKGLIKEGILADITKENKKALIALLKDKNITDEQILLVVNALSNENLSVVRQLLKDKNFDSTVFKHLPGAVVNRENVGVLKAIAQKGNVDPQEISYIIQRTNKNNSDIALQLLDRAGENSNGLHFLLDSVYSFDTMSKEGLEACKLRKKFLAELLENPNFKLGTDKDGMRNFSISRIISTVNPENYEIAQVGLLKQSKLPNLSGFVEGITQENKAIAERILSYSSGEAVLPNLKYLDVEAATKYLDEVAKIDNPELKNLYIEAMDRLDAEKIDDILNIIKSSTPETARHATQVITCMNRGLSVEEIEPMLKMIEQSGRNLDDGYVTCLAIYGKYDEFPVSKFLERILKNKDIPDEQIEDLVGEYIRVSERIEKGRFYLPHDIENAITEGKFVDDEVEEIVERLEREYLHNKSEIIEKKLPDILEKLYKNPNLDSYKAQRIFSEITQKNASIAEKYALSPNAAKIDYGLVNESNLPIIETLSEAGVPVFKQREFVSLLSDYDGAVAAKRLELFQKFLKQEQKLGFDDMSRLLDEINTDSLKYLDEIMARGDLTTEQMINVLSRIKNGANADIVIKCIQDKSIKGKYISHIMNDVDLRAYKANPELAEKALDLHIPLTTCAGTDLKPCIDVLGENYYRNIIKAVEEANVKYGITPKSELSLLTYEGHSNDLFTVLSGSDVTYKFDKVTGRLVNITQGKTSKNIPKGTTVTDDVCYEPSKMGGYYPDVPYRISTSVNGKTGELGTLYTESAIKGQYDIYNIKPDGTRVRIGHAQITPNGAKHIRRTLTSLDGSKTYTAFREDKAGNSYLHSVITDKSGKQVSDITRTFKVISKNHFVSTKNGQAYDIVFTDKNVVVTKLDAAGKKTAEKVEYVIRDDITTEQANEIGQKFTSLSSIDDAYNNAEKIFAEYGIRPNTIDKRCLAALKQLPGDEWFALDKSCKFVFPQSLDPGNAFYAGNSIFLSAENNILPTFCHELGHAKFQVLDLVNDKELLKIYNAEKDAFTRTFPKSRIEFIDYFLQDNNNLCRGLNELCAETNLSSATVGTWHQTQARTLFLEQYFPNTAAYIREKYALLS